MQFKKLLYAIALSLTLTSTAMAQETKPTNTDCYVTTTLNIRETPDGNIIGHYNEGDKVTVTEYDKNWAHTEKGWVYTPYLSTDPNGNQTITVNIKPRSIKPNASFEEKVKIFSDEYESAEYKHQTDTIFVTSNSYTLGSGFYYLTHIIIKDPAQIHHTLSYDNWGGTREYPTDVAKRTDAIVVTNGSYFSYDTGNPTCAGIFINNSQIMQNGITNGKEICLDFDGKLFTPEKNLSAFELIHQGIIANWGTSDPLLISDGTYMDTTTTTHNYPYPRTAISMVEPKEYYIITAGSSDYNGGLTYNQLQDIFGQLGCTFARSLDGGGSASLVINKKLINTPAAGEERPVVDFLYFTE